MQNDSSQKMRVKVKGISERSIFTTLHITRCQKYDDFFFSLSLTLLVQICTIESFYPNKLK